jgi:hypothetical protein
MGDAAHAHKDAYRKKHGDVVSKKDHDAYVLKSKKRGKLKRPLSFKDYKDLASFYGKKDTEKDDPNIIWKGGMDWHGKYKKSGTGSPDAPDAPYKPKGGTTLKRNKGGIARKTRIF